MQYPEIANEIIALKEADLALRDKLIQKKELGKGYNKEMEALHNTNAEKLEVIIENIGYPTIDKVGKEANDAAWLIIQHAISQPAFMKRCRALIEANSSQDLNTRIKLAYLVDRIAYFEEKAQLYGTQFDWDESGELNPTPYDDLDKVNERRANLKLNTLAEQTMLIRFRAKQENELPPHNMESRKQEMQEWKRKVGWI